jgi:uncharacterized membrane protein YfcA
MKRHAFDALSFAFGIVFVAIAGALTMGDLHIHDDILRWVGAGILLIVGAVMLFGTRSTQKSADGPELDADGS